MPKTETLKRLKRNFIVCLFILPAFIPLTFADTPIKTARLCYGETCFSVELAQTVESRRLGLMGRETLAADQGMLLVFDSVDRHSIWMKNMRIPLDILWLDENLVVTDIKAEIQPCEAMPCPSYVPQNPAKYVLELPAKTAEINKISPSAAFIGSDL